MCSSIVVNILYCIVGIVQETGILTFLMSIAEINVCRQLIIILFEGPSLQSYCMLITITLNDAHSTCVAMCMSSVSARTLNCVVFLFPRKTSLQEMYLLSCLY